LNLSMGEWGGDHNLWAVWLLEVFVQLRGNQKSERGVL
jgi:hypothetical protein